MHTVIECALQQRAPEGSRGFELAVVYKVRKRVLAQQIWNEVDVSRFVELAVPALRPARRELKHALSLVFPFVVLHQVAGNVLLFLRPQITL